MRPRPPISTLFPYTTLFRSRLDQRRRSKGPRLPLGARRRPRVVELRKDDRHGAHWVARERSAPFRLQDRKSTRLNSSHTVISYAVFCLKKKKVTHMPHHRTQ